MRLARHLPRCVNHDDIRALARTRLPRVLFDFVDGGAESEWTLRDNARAFEEITLCPRQASVVDAPLLRAELLGTPVAMPILAAPCGTARLVHPDGERAIARACADAGLGYVVPHMGGHDVRDVGAISDGLLWYQLYKMGSRAMAEAAIARAADAGCRALVVTVDNSPTLRERDVRNGMGALTGGTLGEKLRHSPQVLARPAWLARFLADGRPLASPNAIMESGLAMAPRDVAAVFGRGQATFAWSDFTWLNRAWQGPIVVKGILGGEDARRAVEAGASAVIVSNHGGRALDGVPATIRVLPEVVAAVGGACEIYLDSGVRRGADVIKALCLGAKAVLVGRPTIFGLAMGTAGVSRTLAILADDVRRTMAALGCASLDTLDPSFVRVPQGFVAPERGRPR